jgi:lactoylglutathione lyase
MAPGATIPVMPGFGIRSAALFCLCVGLAAAAERPRILGLAHVAVAVSDVEQARAFYGGILGFAEPFLLRNADGSLSMTFYKINEDQYVEVFPGLDASPDRLRHIAFHTDNVEALRAYLASRGIQVPDRVPKGRIGNSNFTIKDPDGHLVEFVQYEPDGWTRREKGKHLGANRVSTRLLHAGILVGNIEAANAFYGETLGFRETWRGSRDGKTLDWVNMRVPDGDDYIEYMLYTKMPAPNARGVQHHICLEVPDGKQALDALEKNPNRKTYTRPLEPRTGTNRRWQLNLYDADGTRTELMEPRTVDGIAPPSATAPPPVVR